MQSLQRKTIEAKQLFGAPVQRAVTVGGLVEVEEPLDLEVIFAQDTVVRPRPIRLEGLETIPCGATFHLYFAVFFRRERFFMPASPPAGRKEALRRHFRAVREALTEDDYRRRSGRLVEQLSRLPELRAARVVHSYWPVIGRREVDVRPLLETLLRDGRTVVLPVVADTAPGTAPRMTHHRYEGPGCLRTNRWGLAEPAGTPAVPAASLEAVVVPAFGAGRNGHRIGHGRGFYDAFLAGLDAAAVCPVYDDCLVNAVPFEPHDVPLRVIVAETEVVRPARIS